MRQLMKIMAWLIVLGTCTAMGVQEFQIFQDWAGRRSYEIDAGISRETAEAVLRSVTGDEDIGDLVFWTQKNSRTVATRAPVKRNTEVNLILICGDPRILTGNYNVPQPMDTGTCLIGRTAAYQLFGDTEVVGASVEYDGREYIICGVMETADSDMIIQMPAESEEMFARITIMDAGNWNVKNVLQNKYQISVTEIQWNFLRGIVELLFLFTVIASYMNLVCLWNRKQTFTAKKRRGIYWTIEFTVGTLLVSVFQKNMGLAQLLTECIPAKWSEFSFYAELWNIWTEGMEKFLEMALSALEIRWFMNCVSLGVWIILGGSAFVLNIRLMESYLDGSYCCKK